MMKRLMIVLLFATYAYQAQSQNNILYKLVYGNSQKSIDLSSARAKKVFSEAISDHGNKIPATMIDNISFQGHENLKDYGKVDLFKIRLKNNPSVLSPYFLVIVNHEKKELQSINIDRFKLIKIHKSDVEKFIIALTNIRGNVDLQFYQYKLDRLRLYQTDNIFSFTECKKIKPNSIVITNQDINHDGLLDICISYEQVNYCDKDGNNSEKPLEKVVINKSFIASSKKSGIWQLTK